MTETKPRKPVCSHCGGANVTHDALVTWNMGAQEWEIASVLDNGDCEDCGCECRIEWIAADAELVIELTKPGRGKARP